MFDDLTLLDQGYHPRFGGRKSKHFDGYWSIQYASTGGCIALAYDGEKTEIEPPAVWTCYPGPHIQFNAARRGERWDHRYLTFVGPRVARWRSEGLWFEGACSIPPRLEPQFTEFFVDAIGAAAGKTRRTQMLAISTLDRILLELMELREPSLEQRPKWLGDVIAEIGDLNAEEPDYSALARNLSMSLSTLRRRFKSITGTTMHDYRVQCRMTKAQSLLSNTNRPVKEVADALGYHDVYYFTRQFAKHVGVPPATYRRAKQE